jgi:hypothetical protein
VAAFARNANELVTLHDGIGVRYGFILMLRSRFVHYPKLSASRCDMLFQQASRR